MRELALRKERRRAATRQSGVRFHRSLLLLTTSLCGLSAAADDGTLCLRVARWEFAQAISVPGAKPRPVARFTVQVDDGPQYDVTDRAWLVEGLPRDVKHRVRVRGDGVLRETFFFRLDATKPSLELTHDGGYDSWRLGVPRRSCPTP